MTVQTLYLSVLAASMTLSKSANPAALASVELVTNYAFDDNVEARVMVVDTKTTAPANDPLNNLVFKVAFTDKINGGLITELKGRLYTGGGIEALEESHANDFNYITGKLDFYGALDNEYDFFESVTTSYSAAQADAIKTALTTNGALNQMGDYRVKEKVLAVPATAVSDITADALKTSLLNMRDRPRYITSCEVGSLPHIEAIAEVVGKLNCHAILDAGNIKDWQSVVGLVEAMALNDHRIAVLWNPNESRPSGASTVLARKKWRPCVGDYLAKLLIRNAATNASGIPPLNRPIAGYDFPVSFRDIEQFDGLTLDEEAQNALAEAGVNVVINERFEGGDRWIYGDALTQYDSKTSALRLTNAAEIETYTTNGVLGITKKHLLKGMSTFITDATDECERFLSACSTDTAGLLKPSSELGGLYYALSITPRADAPFEKADVKLSRRPEGCARQVFYEGVVTK